MRLPRLPVSRRRHEATVQTIRDCWAATSEKAMDAVFARDAAWARIAELERAVREHQVKTRKRTFGCPTIDDRKLWSALDGHDRQEGEWIPDPAHPHDPVPRHPGGRR